MDAAMINLIRDAIGTKSLADYLTADSDCTLGVYTDGTVLVGNDVGREIGPDERPIATAKCPGIGNLDMTYFREGWNCDDLTDKQVIRHCCKHGDVSGEFEDLIARLTEEG